MLSTETINTFNTMRALVYVHSPQVREEDGHIVILNEYGNVETIVAKLKNENSFCLLCSMIHDNPVSVELVECNDVAVIRYRKYTNCHLAYMLT